MKEVIGMLSGLLLMLVGFRMQNEAILTMGAVMIMGCIILSEREKHISAVNLIKKIEKIIDDAIKEGK